jgi:hypothetical protein
MGQRIAAVGYTYAGAGENVAWNQRSAIQVMNSWMQSPSHRQNILNPSFKNIGIGLSDKFFWTRVFGNPRGDSAANSGCISIPSENKKEYANGGVNASLNGRENGNKNENGNESGGDGTGGSWIGRVGQLLLGVFFAVAIFGAVVFAIRPNPKPPVVNTIKSKGMKSEIFTNVPIAHVVAVEVDVDVESNRDPKAIPTLTAQSSQAGRSSSVHCLTRHADDPCGPPG